MEEKKSRFALKKSKSSSFAFFLLPEEGIKLKPANEEKEMWEIKKTKNYKIKKVQPISCKRRKVN